MKQVVDDDAFEDLPFLTRPIAAIKLLPRPEQTPADGHAGTLDDLPVPEDSRWEVWGAAWSGARETLSTAQARVLIGVLAAAVVATALRPHLVLLALTAVMTVLYVGAAAYKSWLLWKGEHSTGALHPDPDALADADLPEYSVLVPLLREGTLLPVLLDQLDTIDYPRDRLEVLLLVEADDTETRDVLRKVTLSPQMRVVIVPPGKPRTKPRALNVGLAEARGEFVVVYDAEDRPERDQLRKAVAAFRSLPSSIICLQARLNFYNRHQTVLTRLFSVDYAIWYDMLLAGLVGPRACVPLGGTSNHFRTGLLRRLGGWDPFNVTEDADLGMRIARAGLQVNMLDSTTWEEAVAHVPQWIRQRSRWVKGYMQTYLVHMRHPVRMWREMGPRAFLDFQLLVGGSSLMLLVNPLMWIVTILYFATKGTPFSAGIEALYPRALYYPALCCLLANAVFLYAQLYVCVRRGYEDLARYSLLGPLYWTLMSIGAWVGLGSLIRRPHYWAKTEHGVSLLGNLPSLRLAEPAVAATSTGVFAAVANSGVFAAVTNSGVFPALSQSGAFAAVAVANVPTGWQSTRGTVATAAFDVETADDGLAEACDTPLPLCTLSLSVVLPAHNEEAVIVQTVRSTVNTLDQWGMTFEVIVVDDGSSDRTGALVERLTARDDRIRLVTHPVNQGYGAALVSGFRSAIMDLTFFMDSDGQFDIADLARFFPLLDDHDAVIGYRMQRQDTLMRRLNGLGWTFLVRTIFGLSVRDIDCAFKLFRTEKLHASGLETRGATINAEMLYKFSRAGGAFAQVGVHHLPRSSGQATGAKPAVIARALRELALYGWRWRVRGR